MYQEGKGPPEVGLPLTSFRWLFPSLCLPCGTRAQKKYPNTIRTRGQHGRRSAKTALTAATVVGIFPHPDSLRKTRVRGPSISEDHVLLFRFCLRQKPNPQHLIAKQVIVVRSSTQRRCRQTRLLSTTRNRANMCAAIAGCTRLSCVPTVAWVSILKPFPGEADKEDTCQFVTAPQHQHSRQASRRAGQKKNTST